MRSGLFTDARREVWQQTRRNTGDVYDTVASRNEFRLKRHDPNAYGAHQVEEFHKAQDTAQAAANVGPLPGAVAGARPS